MAELLGNQKTSVYTIYNIDLLHKSEACYKISLRGVSCSFKFLALELSPS